MKFATLPTVLLFSFLFLTPAIGFAETRSVNIGVKGMTCGFCTRGIKKRFEKLSAVEKATPNLDEKRVEVILKDGQELTDDQINKIVDDSGYEVTSVTRSPSSQPGVADQKPAEHS